MATSWVTCAWQEIEQLVIFSISQWKTEFFHVNQKRFVRSLISSVRDSSVLFLGSGPEGADDLCFQTFLHTMLSFLLLLPLLLLLLHRPPPLLGLQSYPWGPNPNLKVPILDSRLWFQPLSSNSSQPRGWDPSPKAPTPAKRLQSRVMAQVPASVLKYKPSIGHQLLSCPSHLHILHTLRGNRYCWPSEAFATINNKCVCLEFEITLREMIPSPIKKRISFIFAYQ